MKQACSQCGAEISLPGQAVVEGYVCPGCRGSLPRRFGKYAVTGFIGAGGMGQVYKASHPELLRTVAIKVLPEQEDPDLVRRFLREAQVAAKLDHPGIVRVHDTGQDGPRHYIVMEFVEGRPLNDLVGKVDFATAVRIVAEVARTLHYAHEQGVIHRDIKPSNILLDPKGRPRLLDFGLAKGRDDASLTSTGQIVGTPHYMAPEQAAGGETDRRTDVYALGAVLYELATGKAPLHADTVLALLRKIESETPRRPSEVRPGLPAALDAICAKALAKKPGERFQSAEELATSVESMQVVERRPRRAKWPLAFLALVPILATAVAFWPRGKRPEPEPQARVEQGSPPPKKEETPAPPAVTATSSARSLLRLAIPGVYGFDADLTSDHPLVVALRLTQEGEYERAERALQGATGRDAYYVRGVIAIDRSIHLTDSSAPERWLKEFPSDPEPRLRDLRAFVTGTDDPTLSPVIRMILAARAGKFEDPGPELWPAQQFLRLVAGQRFTDDEVRAGLKRDGLPPLLQSIYHALMSDWPKAEALLGGNYTRLRGSDLIRDFATKGTSSRPDLQRYGALLQFQHGDAARGVRTAQGLLGSGTASREIRADLNYLLATHFGRRGDETRFLDHLEQAVKNGASPERAKVDFPKWKDDARFRKIVGE